MKKMLVAGAVAGAVITAAAWCMPGCL